MATKTPFSLARNDVNAVINGGVDSGGVTWSASAVEDGTRKQWALDGDTISLAAGTSPDWTAPITVSGKNLQIVGAGMLDGGTKLTGTPTNGRFFIFNTINSDKTARIAHINIHIKLAANEGGTIQWLGNSRMHRVSGAYKGGIRCDHVRWTAETVAISKLTFILWIQGWLTGVVDHCFIDYDLSQSFGSEVISIAHNTSITGANIPAEDGGTVARYGDWSWYKPYIFGADFANIDGTPDRDAIYFEDNIFNLNGFVIDTISAAAGDGGGARLVVRHNTSSAGIGTHGMDSGNHCGSRAVEFYNNKLDYHQVGAATPPAFTIRGGTGVVFNNRMTAWPRSGGSQIGFYRPESAIGHLGVSDGTNFFELNERGTIVYNGFTVPAISSPADTRVGSIYAQGTGSAVVSVSGGSQVIKFTLTGLSGAGASGKWKGYVLRNETTSLPESEGGGQTTIPPLKAYGFIVDSDTSNPVVVSVMKNSIGNNLSMASADSWTIRRVKQYINLPGSGPMQYCLNGGSILDYPFNHTYAKFNGLADPNPRWCNQSADGCYFWGNKNRDTITSPFANISQAPNDAIGTVIYSFFPGGINNSVQPSYPQQANTAANLRIGADWDATAILSTDPGAATQAYGAPYPHPLVGAATVGAIMLLQIPGNRTTLAFGNVIKGTTKTISFLIRNIGDTALTISSITYPTGYTGPFSGTIAAGSAAAVSVVFAPVALIDYNGTITVNSDKTSGVNTLPVTGKGVAAATSSTAASGIKSLGRTI